MIYCRKCGTALQSSVKFCPQCGCGDPSDSQFTQIPATQQTTPVQQSAPVQSWPSQTQKVDFCSKCGAPMKPNTTFCAKCGYSRPVPAMKEKKLAWWKIAVPVVLVLALVVALFWSSILLHVAPTLVLMSSFENTTEALAGRAEGTPVELVLNAYENKKVTTAFQMNYQLQDVEMELNLTAQTDSSDREGQIDLNFFLDNSYSSGTVNGQLYFNTEYMALNLDPFTDGEYYGIAYDTFEDDLGGNDYLCDNLGDEAVDILEQVVEIWSNVLNDETEDMVLTGDYSEVFKEFLNEHKPEIGTASVSLDSKDRSCDTLTYELTAEDLGELMEDLVNLLEDEENLEDLVTSFSYDAFEDWIYELQDSAKDLQDADADITLYFCLYKNRIAYATLLVDADGSETEMTLNLGTNPAASDILFTVEDDYTTLEVTLIKEVSGKVVTETLEMYEKYSSNKVESVFGYEWDTKNGDLTIYGEVKDSYDQQDFELELTLIEENGGFTLEIPDLIDWAAELNDMARSEFNDTEMSMGLYVSKGAEITAPDDYTNISKITEAVVEEFAKNAEDAFN